MDINKLITNEILVDIMRMVKQNEAKEELFWKEIYKAKFLCPMKMELRSAVQGANQKIVLEEETTLALLSINNGQGEHFLMAFTDWDELRKWKQNEGQQTLILSYEDYQEIIIKGNSAYQGMVINPFGENIVLGRQLLADTMKNEHIVKKGESVMLGIPREYPVDMINKLKEYFISEQNVDKAYLLWMVRGKKSSYLLILDTKMPPQQLFPAIGKVCQPFLNGNLIDMVLADSNLGKNAVEEYTPFFIK